jgi:hypothetical protein
LKYLIIGVLLALVFILLYRRVRNYIEVLLKIARVAAGVLDSSTARSTPERKVQSKNKLSRCVACGTWVPAERAITSGSSLYCSAECREKIPLDKERKIAG